MAFICPAIKKPESNYSKKSFRDEIYNCVYEAIFYDGGLDSSYYCPGTPITYNDGEESIIIGPIIGGVVGAIVLIIIVTVISCYCCCKKKDKNQPIQVLVHQEQKPLTQPVEMPQPQQCFIQPQYFV